MSNYTLLFYSKTKYSLNNFLNFLKNNKDQNFKIIIKKILNRKIKRKKISILKSPHVNKTAQEHYQYVYFCSSLSVQTYEIKKILFLVKKIKNQLFPDLKIIVKGYYSKKKIVKEKCRSPKKLTFSYKTYQKINQNHFKIRAKNENLLKKIVFYLTVLDSFGKNSYIEV